MLSNWKNLESLRGIARPNSVAARVLRVVQRHFSWNILRAEMSRALNGW
eukprot:SAG31_NODE_23532_length_502_cov_0.885856_1_plen_48_part_10